MYTYMSVRIRVVYILMRGELEAKVLNKYVLYVEVTEEIVR
jgi:hypothetical protein